MSKATDKRRYAGSTVVITGASSGLGEEFARQFAARHADVVLVARRIDRLEALADELLEAYGVTGIPIAMDLAAPGAAVQLVAELDARGIAADSLVNNAGFGMSGPFAEADPERLDQMVSLNVGVLTALTRAFLPGLTGRGRGVLINIASTAAYQPLPTMAAYAATKAYVLSLTEAIGYEVRGSGLEVLALSPGPTRTEFFDIAGNGASVGRFQTAEQVVTTALDELDRKHPRPSVVSGRANSAQARAVSRLPRRLALWGAARAME